MKSKLQKRENVRIQLRLEEDKRENIEVQLINER